MKDFTWQIGQPGAYTNDQTGSFSRCAPVLAMAFRKYLRSWRAPQDQILMLVSGGRLFLAHAQGDLGDRAAAAMQGVLYL